MRVGRVCERTWVTAIVKPSKRRFRQRATAILAALSLSVTGLSIIDNTIAVVPGAEAANAADFNPGNIISDAVFYNSGTMTVAQIQSFLNARVPTCRSGYECLKSYTQATVSQPRRTEGCAPYTGAARETAAEIIYKVAQACGINPQAILVLLEKEQGLVSDDWPSSRQYRSATGYGCPDTADCDTNYYGFFNQVYHASYQFKKYQYNPGIRGYKAGQINTILWNPNSGCGSSQVYIENQATAGLYVYTPYRPNQAALNNLYGTGDGCSAYGNRNFWRMFTDWFGSTTGGIAVAPQLQSLVSTGVIGQATVRFYNYVDGGVGQEFSGGWAYWRQDVGAQYTTGKIGLSYTVLAGPFGVLGYPAQKPETEIRGGSSQQFQLGALYTSPTTSIHIVSGPILTSYKALRGPSGIMGYPLAAFKPEPAGGSSQLFEGGWLYTSPATSIHRVSGPIGQSYAALGGPAGSLGFPIAAEKSEGNGWISQKFQAGSLLYSASGGIHFMLNDIYSKWTLDGGVNSPYGVPTDSTKSYTDGGTGQRFSKMWLYYSAATGYSTTVGVLGTSHFALGGGGGTLGYPTEAQKNEANGGISQKFSGAALYWSPSYGIHFVLSPIRDEYTRGGGVNGPLGHPTDSTKSYSNGVGQRFAKGWAYWSTATGFATTAGAIGNSYSVLGGPDSFLGYPIAAQKSEASGGVSQTFQHGTLYWSPSAGIHYVLNKVNEGYLAQGGVGGLLGHATDSTKSYGNGFGQRFQNGWLYWSDSTGFILTTGWLGSSHSLLGGPSGVLGFPVAAQKSESGGGLSQEFQNGWLVYSAATSIDRVQRPIGEFYYANGGPGGMYGYPLDSTISMPNGDLEQRFQGGKIRWTAAGGAVPF